MALSTMIWQLSCIIIIPVVSAETQYEAAPNVTAGRSSPQSQLYIKLMDEYGPQSLRPIYNQSDQIQVGLGAIPASLVALRKAKYVTKNRTGIVRYRPGRIKKLTWDPSDHEGVRSLVIDVEDIWTPDIILLESIGDTFEESNNGYARVNYKGEIIWYNMVVTVTFCKLLIRYFPFDMQHCNLSFTSWNYDLSQIDFFYVHELTIEEQIDQFVKNGAWTITGLTVEHINHTKGCDPNYFVPYGLPYVSYVSLSELRHPSMRLIF
ncbi:putative neuronal acetylcholine receptor subunit alpha-9-II [Apostichopus japonicus]|uniref:Putative neuronal acetylcholine receptor subunit alpha-9-II n=1 Tax=Stichopus japonicus TaxID=307972 RepID=A0A2G8LK18_STIJA|nr:putative neuronal acetylcholine receptor subunit alpha-9-II [Apostichopus japonicus]